LSFNITGIEPCRTDTDVHSSESHIYYKWEADKKASFRSNIIGNLNGFNNTVFDDTLDVDSAVSQFSRAILDAADSLFKKEYMGNSNNRNTPLDNSSMMNV
jgi:hypothetical protein